MHFQDFSDNMFHCAISGHWSDTVTQSCCIESTVWSKQPVHQGTRRHSVTVVTGQTLLLNRADIESTVWSKQPVHQGTRRHSVTGHQLFCFSMCHSDTTKLANDPSAAQRLQLGTLCHLLPSTVTLLCLNLD